MTERSIFLAALDIDDPAERSAYPDRACADDPTLRGQVELLLRAHQDPGSFMQHPAPCPSATVDDPVTERAEGTGPATVGPEVTRATRN